MLHASRRIRPLAEIMRTANKINTNAHELTTNITNYIPIRAIRLKLVLISDCRDVVLK